MDQAGTLRKIMDNRQPVRTFNAKSLKVISITSGKGGVGKTNVVANLAYALSTAGKKVLVLDGDFGLANMNIVMGLEPKGTIHDVISGKKEISDIVLKGPGGVMLLPASSGVFKMSNLSMADKAVLMDRLESASLPFDILLIDTGAGINSDVMYLNSAATDVVVVATPEPTSITDAYALMKVMSKSYNVKKFKLVVNMVRDEKEGLAVYNNILDVADKFLNVGIDYLGSIEYDRRISQSVISRKVFLEKYPDLAASKSIENISKVITKKTPEATLITGNIQFFWRSLMTNEVSV